MVRPGGVLFRVAPYVIDTLPCFFGPLPSNFFQPRCLRTRQTVDKAYHLSVAQDGEPFMLRH